MFGFTDFGKTVFPIVRHGIWKMWRISLNEQPLYPMCFYSYCTKQRARGMSLFYIIKIPWLLWGFLSFLFLVLGIVVLLQCL